MKITDAYHCADLGGVSQAGLVGMTARGFNVFKRQTRPQGNSGSEDAFRLTPKHGINADLLMTVVRHEAAHHGRVRGCVIPYDDPLPSLD